MRPGHTAAPERAFAGRPLIAVLCLLAVMGFVAWLRLMPLQLAGIAPWIEDTLRASANATLLATPDSRDAARNDMRRAAREALTVEGADGSRHPYLGDIDSYHWLRAARSVLRGGSPCDEVADGICRDRLALAPVGAAMADGESFHVRAIVALHRVLDWLQPGVPLMLTAMLLPVVVAVIGVIPAFAIAWRLAGVAGGFAAAVAISTNPLFLLRTMGGDNDIWNVVLPLFMVWLTIEALRSSSFAARVSLALGASGVAGLHAATWSGWTFGVFVIAAALCAGVVLELARAGAAGRRGAFLAEPAISAPLLVACVFLAGAALLAAALGRLDQLAELPLGALRTVGLVSPGMLPGEALPWPDMFRTVAELAPQSRLAMAGELGGVLVVGGVLGLCLVALPRSGLNRWHVAMIAWICIFAVYLFLSPGTSRIWLVLAIALPPLVVLASEIRLPAPRPAGFAPELIVILWFLAALFLAHQGGRFVMLLVAPFGIAFGVVIGRLVDLLLRLASRWPRLRGFAVPLVVAAVALPLVPTSRAGWAAAATYLPIMDDAWWNSLARIRDESAPDAIVTSWWDYGHWSKYVAERRATSDGATLRTHVHHWLARALATERPAESLGLLRMLNCGSDATPYPEAARGAFGRLVAGGMSERDAYRTIIELVVLPRAAARDHLSRAGLEPTRAAAVLEATHCDPPESYLLVSDRLLIHKQRGWLRTGLWDYENPQLDPPLAPPGATSPRWHPCQHEGASLDCRIGIEIPRTGVAIERIVVSTDAPGTAQLILLNRTTGARAARPVRVLVATGNGFADYPIEGGAPHDLAVLLDPERFAAFLGAPSLLRSTLARLVLLQGRLTEGYERVDARTSIYGETITTWRIRFPREP